MPENAPDLGKSGQCTCHRCPQTQDEKYASYCFDKRGSEYCNAMCLLQLGDAIVKESDNRSAVVGLKDPVPGQPLAKVENSRCMSSP